MTVGLVQDCGCVALPEDVRQQTGLNPGASFRIEAADDGSSVTLIVLERKEDRLQTLAACPIPISNP